MIVKTDDIHYKNIAKAIGSSDTGLRLFMSEFPDGILPSEMPNAIRSVVEGEFNSGYYFGHQAGKYEGKEEGIIEGIEQGKKAEYDKFWDAYQQNGKRVNYSYGFFGDGFDFTNFYPKYDIIPTGSTQRLFYAWNRGNNHKGSLAQRLRECGVVLDTSKITEMSYTFAYTVISEIPTIDTTGQTQMSYYVFSDGYESLRKIEKIIVKDGIDFGNWFRNTNLEEVTFEGVIGGSGLNLQWSTRLNKASIESIITHLSDNTSGLSITLSKTAVNNAFAGGSEGDEWLNLIATKNNWTINLI